MGPREPPPSCPEVSQRTGTHPASCNSHSSRPDPAPTCHSCICQVSSRLEVAAAVDPGHPPAIRDIPYLTSRFQVLDKLPHNVDHLSLPCPCSLTLSHSAHPAHGRTSRLSSVDSVHVGLSLKHASPPTSADIRSTLPRYHTTQTVPTSNNDIRNHDTRASLRKTLLWWLQSTCIRAAR